MIDVNVFLSNSIEQPNDSEDIDYSLLLSGIQACSLLNNLSSIVVDFDKHKSVFMSDNLIYLDEATIRDFKRPSENPYMSLADETVIEKLSIVYNDYAQMKDKMTPEEYLHHMCIMDYPIIIKGREFYITSKFTPIIMGQDGRIKLGVFSIFPSNKREVSFLVITSTGKRWSYDFGKRIFNSYDLNFKLSLMERAILQRARKGMSNEEIANDLFLSLNTIKSHRLHIFKKLGVKSISEALVTIGNYKLM